MKDVQASQPEMLMKQPYSMPTVKRKMKFRGTPWEFNDIRMKAKNKEESIIESAESCIINFFFVVQSNEKRCEQNTAWMLRNQNLKLHPNIGIARAPQRENI